jgi:hypothetical protein
MDPMSRHLPIITAAGLLLVAGLVHGFWTDRWTTSEALAEAAARLAQLPQNVGDWQGQNLDIQREETEAITGHLYRRYVNRSTGASVTVALVCGKPGPVSIHTPDACYRAGGFEVATPTRVSVPGEAGKSAGEFLYADLSKKTATEHIRQRIFWSWSPGGEWQVPDNPREDFVRQPVLFKWYVIRDIQGANEPAEDDPCTDLIRQLAPQLRQMVFARS